MIINRLVTNKKLFMPVGIPSSSLSTGIFPGFTGAGFGGSPQLIANYGTIASFPFTLSNSLGLLNLIMRNASTGIPEFWYSSDNYTFTDSGIAGSSGISNAWENINGYYVIGGTGGNSFTKDGLTWATGLATPATPYALCWNGTYYVMGAHTNSVWRQTTLGGAWSAQFGIFSSATDAIYNLYVDNTLTYAYAFVFNTTTNIFRVAQSTVANMFTVAGWTTIYTFPTTYGGFSLAPGQLPGFRILNGYIYYLLNGTQSTNFATVVFRAPLSNLANWQTCFTTMVAARRVADIAFVSGRGYLLIDNMGFLYSSPESDGVNFAMSTLTIPSQSTVSGVSGTYCAICAGINALNNKFITVIGVKNVIQSWAL